ncbi:histone-like nucleoid-structuring protein Lsr2 [Actinoplanes aureus]|uniref:Lsr2 family protein n=1 Tax=Actinoplanes aureus TaxID=2792083 RepID=A0A931CIA6_9ACTN|nr:Lsr2 family protein [Actinoplanes aureus]MBG0564885.1 Lsr2 family protein [Actinoplanes aureus]MBG0569104.1 Lsr2 family protein [Actinoplanes aureus]
MAKQVVTILTDDLDGGGADRTVEFGLDGVNYTIDLSDKNAGKLRKALEPFISAGTRRGRAAGVARRGPGRAGVAGAGSSRRQNQAIREWARKNGRKVSERGRIPTEVVEAYNSSR